MTDQFEVYGIDLDCGRGFDSFRDAKATWTEKVPWGSRWRINFQTYEVISLLGKPFFQIEGGENDG